MNREIERPIRTPDDPFVDRVQRLMRSRERVRRAFQAIETVLPAQDLPAVEPEQVVAMPGVIIYEDGEKESKDAKIRELRQQIEEIPEIEPIEY